MYDSLKGTKDTKDNTALNISFEAVDTRSNDVKNRSVVFLNSLPMVNSKIEFKLCLSPTRLNSRPRCSSWLLELTLMLWFLALGCSVDYFRVNFSTPFDCCPNLCGVPLYKNADVLLSAPSTPGKVHLFWSLLECWLLCRTFSFIPLKKSSGKRKIVNERSKLQRSDCGKKGQWVSTNNMFSIRLRWAPPHHIYIFLKFYLG